MGSKQFQVKSGHRAEMDWEENMGSKEISKNKRRHRGKMNGTEKTGSKEFQVKNGHLTKMDWEEKMESE